MTPRWTPPFFGSKCPRRRRRQLRERAEKLSDGYHGEDERDHGEQRSRKILQAGRISRQRSCEAGGEMKCLLAELIQAETAVQLDLRGTRDGKPELAL